MPEAYIVDAVRTPTGRRKGGLAHVHGADLGAHVLKAIVERNGIPDNEYDDVIFGCVDTSGPLAGDIARTCWLAVRQKKITRQRVFSSCFQGWIYHAVFEKYLPGSFYSPNML